MSLKGICSCNMNPNSHSNGNERAENEVSERHFASFLILSHCPSFQSLVVPGQSPCLSSKELSSWWGTDRMPNWSWSSSLPPWVSWCVWRETHRHNFPVDLNLLSVCQCRPLSHLTRYIYPMFGGWVHLVDLILNVESLQLVCATSKSSLGAYNVGPSFVYLCV